MSEVTAESHCRMVNIICTTWAKPLNEQDMTIQQSRMAEGRALKHVRRF